MANKSSPASSGAIRKSKPSTSGDTAPPPSMIPPNSRNKGIMASIRKLKVGQFILAEKTTRNRFSTDFARLGWKCATRIDDKDKTKIRVYRSK